MQQISRRFRQLHSFHSRFTPPGCSSRGTWLRTGPCVYNTTKDGAKLVFAQRLDLHTQPSDREVTSSLLARSGPLLNSLPSRTPVSVRSAARMRDLVNIAALSTSSALAVNASPQKPERDANQNRGPRDDEGLVGTTEEVYQEAVRKLNTLQSNFKTLDAIRKNQDQGAYKNIPDVIDYASRVGISLDRLDELSCIHIAGTKGKGSVCAFTESILRNSGLRTGFFSSPHLVEVRERIRLDGKPLPKEKFAKNFFTIFNRLEATKEQYGGKMPAYFRFLTLMAFHTFLEEKVDVAIMEVGIGGEFDCTNIIRKPVVVGITSLGIDHTSVLGNTLDQIAWHKAGIIKTGRPAFTVPQPEQCIQVIQERAREKEAELHVVPSLTAYDFHGHDVMLGLAGMHHYLNAALALQLAKTFIAEERPEMISFEDQDEPRCKERRVAERLPVSEEVLTGGDVPEAEAFSVPEQFEMGLKSCYWPGRNQIIQRDKVTYYVDGAHTPRSISACCRWFREKAEVEATGIEGPVARILIFNSTGNRDEYSLLPRLVACGFHGVVFCPNIVSLYSHDSSADSTNYTTTTERQLKRCQQNLLGFQNILKDMEKTFKAQNSSELTSVQSSNAAESLKEQGMGSHPLAEVNQSSHTPGQSGDRTVGADLTGTGSGQFVQSKLVKLSSILDALQWAACCKDSSLSSPSIHDPTPPDQAIAANHIQVLVTGSIHLVGGVISILGPNLAISPVCE